VKHDDSGRKYAVTHELKILVNNSKAIKSFILIRYSEQDPMSQMMNCHQQYNTISWIHIKSDFSRTFDAFLVIGQDDKWSYLSVLGLMSQRESGVYFPCLDRTDHQWNNGLLLWNCPCNMLCSLTQIVPSLGISVNNLKANKSFISATHSQRRTISALTKWRKIWSQSHKFTSNSMFRSVSVISQWFGMIENDDF
jgi:hypothetical protein